MTPRAFYALLDRHRRGLRHQLYCAAVTAAAIYNVNRKDENSPVFTPEMLIGDGSARQAVPKRQTGEEMLAVVRGFLNPMFNGTEPQKTNG